MAALRQDFAYTLRRLRKSPSLTVSMGAQRHALERLILRQGLVLTAIALALGLPAAWLAAKFSASFLYGVHPHDAVTFTLVPIFLAAVGVLASWVPAQRAAKVDPQTILRYE
jgi:ABC-type antimicrobial peptide transport system permease subunit